MAGPRDPRLWRALSTVALLVAVVGFLTGGGFAWIALALSGVLFAIELGLARGRARAG